MSHLLAAEQNPPGTEKKNLINSNTCFFSFPSTTSFLAESSHGHFYNGKSTGAHGHGSEQCRRNALPETAGTLGTPRLREAVAHVDVLLVGSETVRLHLALDHVKGVAGEPEHLTGEATVECNLPGGDVFAIDVVARGVRVHHVLKSGEPGAVGESLTPDGDSLTAVNGLEDTVVDANLADAIDGAIVQTSGAMRLALQTNTNVLDGAGKD